jgi:glutathionylspermidine synthase
MNSSPAERSVTLKLNHGCQRDCPLRFHSEPIPDEEFASIERFLQLECCKWDTQLGDVRVLLNRPLLIDPQSWAFVCEAAEKLALEAIGAELELLQRENLQAKIGIPSRMRRVLLSSKNPQRCSSMVRIMRFDFHFTTEGWRISEINSDVPGGFAESSVLPKLYAQHFPEAKVLGNPLEAWRQAMTEAFGGGRIAMLCAPGYLEDQQVVSLLAKELAKTGNDCHLLQHPGQLTWRDGRAFLKGDGYSIDVIFRFYQAEWLCQFPRNTGWEFFFSPSRTLVTNPGLGILSESKRFALIRDEISIPMPTWKELLPACVDPREISKKDRDEWVLKGTFSNTGDEVKLGTEMTDKLWGRLLQKAQRHREQWVAQRRFETVPIDSPQGTLYPCIGVYTINGKACGAYLRLSSRQVTDHWARESALLAVEEN